MLQTPSVWAAQGDIRAPLGMLLKNYTVLPQYQSFPVSFCLGFPSRTMPSMGQGTEGMNLGQRSYGPFAGLRRLLPLLGPPI